MSLTSHQRNELTVSCYTIWVVSKNGQEIDKLTEKRGVM